ncbi:HEAT repeat domain-containing protein [Limnospira platensis CENA597]|uniref:HEAT repeat domain-containing protein n=1 Tax=Limnospira platensis TaxID=118562 RepID=UPI003D6DD739
MRLIRLIRQKLIKSGSQTELLIHFVLLGFTIMVAQAIGMTLGRSLFLAKAGAESLPLFFIIMPLILMVVSGGFTAIIDRFNRPRLFRIVLAVAAVLIIGIRLFINLDLIPIYFTLYIFIWLIYILQFRIEFWTLLSDYFTNLELKQYTAIIYLGTTAGYLFGSILVALISDIVTLENQLLLLPICYGISIGQIYYLESHQNPLPTEYQKPKTQTSNWSETWQTLSKLSRHYPIIIFLIANVFGTALVRGIGEFQYSTIYRQEFPDKQELATFLGYITAALTAIQFLIISVGTTPLIKKLGVPRTNLVYPVMLLGSFIGLLFSYNLTAAVGMQLTYRTLFYSIFLPLTNLNYNGVPTRFGGRLRVWGEGLFSPLGQSIAGIILMVFLGWINPYQVVWVGVILSGFLVVIGYFTGKSYVQSLLGMLRSGSVNLSRVGDGLYLSNKYRPEVRQLLQDKNPQNQVLGLELLPYLENPRDFSSDIENIWVNADDQVRRAVIRLFTTKNMGNNLEFKSLLSSPKPKVRSMALELYIATGSPLSASRLQTLLQDESSEVRALACVAISQIEIDGSIQELYHQVCPTQPDIPTRRALLRAAGESRNPKLIPLLTEVLKNAPPDIKRKGLLALVELCDYEPLKCGQIAAYELNHNSPSVRIAALQVFQKIDDQQWLITVSRYLEDEDIAVRQQAAKTLSCYGNQGLAVSRDYLLSSRPEVVKSAILAIGLVRTKTAENILYNFIQSDLKLINRTRIWQQHIDADNSLFEMLQVAIIDYQNSIIERVFYILSSLGQESTVNAAKVLLSSSDKRARSHAVETLVSLKQGRFLRPLMPLLEKMATGENLTASQGISNIKKYSVLLEVLETNNHWLKMGALMAFAGIPGAIAQSDPDPIISKIAQSLVLKPQQLSISENFMIDRLLLLKNVSLFQTLSLDEILLIDNALESAEYLPGEIIFSEGTLGERFYIIVQGKVRIVREVEGEEKQLALLEAGQHFGEISLFEDFLRSANAIAAEHCVLLTLEKTRFVSLVTQRPQILWEICKFLSQRLRDVNLTAR